MPAQQGAQEWQRKGKEASQMLQQWDKEELCFHSLLSASRPGCCWEAGLHKQVSYPKMLEEPVGLFYSHSVLNKYMAEWRMCNSLYALWSCGFPFGSFAAIFGCGFCLFFILFVLLGGFLGSFGSHFFPTRSIPWPHSLPHLHKHLGWHNAGNGAETGTYKARKGVEMSEVPS